MRTRKTLLAEREMPTSYYNIAADLPRPLDPPLHPGTRKPIGPDDLSAIFPMELIKQEVSKERFIEIPQEVQDIYRMYRPTPLVRAYNLERALDTSSEIYYKYEGVSPAGSHKPNTAIPPGFLQQTGGREATDDGDGSRSMGKRAELRMRPLWP